MNQTGLPITLDGYLGMYVLYRVTLRAPDQHLPFWIACSLYDVEHGEDFELVRTILTIVNGRLKRRRALSSAVRLLPADAHRYLIGVETMSDAARLWPETIPRLGSGQSYIRMRLEGAV